ncbi:phage terminase small subunit [Sedimenticola hydrogenitrophicus]|uniref:phage terminase small subunit n=1 Tax=Sedimenticola hydrogenitrophicus TaxID=2967975 RepID=UPI0023AFBC40|nr:phage terminase small subunit [Sedimenticola hydrogenitrophicus]
MLTPAKKHFMKTKAASETAADDLDSYSDATQYELMLAQLAQHKRQLKAIQSTELKCAKKAEILPEYVPYVEGVIESGSGVQDDVLMTIMLWRIDAGDIPGAIRIAAYALAHGLRMPDQYKRDLATTLAEEVADNAARDPAAIPTDMLLAVYEMTVERDMPDEVRAKLQKAIGIQLSDTDKPAALDHLKRALQLHDRSGVKKQIEKLEREIQQAN